MDTLDRILELLSKKGISKNKLLQDLNLGKNTFVNWESRGTSPNGETLSKIADYFGVTTDYLLGREDKNTENPATDRQLKFALFGDAEIDDELLDEVKYMAKVQQEMRKKKKEEK